MPTSNHKSPEYQRIIRSFRAAVALSGIVILIGMIFYHLVEKISWVDAIYLCVVTLTTVGYGDVTPHTDAGKLFTVVYILVGVGIIATLVNLSIRRAVAARKLK